jgi:hypothetical protein
MARLTNNDLQRIIDRKGYGITSSIGKTDGIGLKSTIGKVGVDSEISNKRQANDVESDSSYESLCAEKLSLNYTGKCRVGIKFFRRRLADYSRANSEKAYIDSLQYAGLIVGDSEKEIWLEDEGQFKVATVEEERVEISLHYEDVDLDNLWVAAKQHGGR